MKSALAFLLFLAVSLQSSDQDVALRREAVRLLERANAVSLSPNLPNLERTVTFRVLDASSTATDGVFTRVVVQGTGRRDEVTFGDYHLVNVYTASGLATTRSKELAPAEIATVMWLTPILLLRFDEKDVIRGINSREVDGHSLRCIQFDTIAGEETDKNEICLDPASGSLVTERIGDEFIENTEFFVFAGALIPAKIKYSIAGFPKLELTQTMTVLKEATPNVLAAPPDAQIRIRCTTWRRAIGESMAQPKPGNGAQDFDVEIRGIIGMDGKIHDAVVQTTSRPDVNAEALSLIKQWVFTPAMCDGRPNQVEANFILHFQRR